MSKRYYEIPFAPHVTTTYTYNVEVETYDSNDDASDESITGYDFLVIGVRPNKGGK